jgi:hypothetical protein
LAGPSLPHLPGIGPRAVPTPSGREASAPHTARLRPARGELLLADAVFAELDRLGAVGATFRSAAAPAPAARLAGWC